MSLYQFMSDNPILPFFLACVLAVVVLSAGVTAANLVNRVIRCINILARGWPPEYLDADGDAHHKSATP